MSGQWAGSTSAADLPADWPARREATRQRANDRCEGRAGRTRCTNQGTECDHIKPRSQGGTHDLSNLQWLCPSCHTRKTTREATQARAAIRAARYRPAEQHPGAPGTRRR